jgi:hypothetical protein
MVIDPGLCSLLIHVDVPPLGDTKRCTECPSHRILPDPDPYDSFCSDDVKVSCVALNGRYVTVGCRPFWVQEETGVPDWCPRKIGHAIIAV